jgi:hypothetical protein
VSLVCCLCSFVSVLVFYSYVTYLLFQNIITTIQWVFLKSYGNHKAKLYNRQTESIKESKHMMSHNFKTVRERKRKKRTTRISFLIFITRFYLPIIALSINGLNSPIRNHSDWRDLKKKSNCMLLTRNSLHN